MEDNIQLQEVETEVDNNDEAQGSAERLQGESRKKAGDEGNALEGMEEVPGEHVEGEHMEEEHMRGEHMGGEHMGGEHMEGEHMEGEHMEGEHLEEDHIEGEYVENEELKSEHKKNILGEGEEMMGEIMEGEQLEGEQEEGKPNEEKALEEAVVEEEEAYVEPPPPDPAAPYDLSDSKEALREPFELRPEQLAEVEQLWELYQNYTPAYTDIDGYITEKELVYMLKSLLIMTYTPEQFQELIDFCVRPPHAEGHITFDQFVKMVTIRQRDFPIEDELRSALQIFDPDKTGSMDREYLKEVLFKQGNKMPQKQLDNLIKEVDLSNDGTIGVEDVIGTMCIDLNKEDIMMLRAAIYPDEQPPPQEND